MIAETFPGRWNSYLETLTLPNTIIQIDKVAFAGSHSPRDVLIRTYRALLPWITKSAKEFNNKSLFIFCEGFSWQI